MIEFYVFLFLIAPGAVSVQRTPGGYGVSYEPLWLTLGRSLLPRKQADPVKSATVLGPG